MAAGKENLGTYTPKMVHAGDYPVVTDSGTVAEGETIVELMPVVLNADGTLKNITISISGIKLADSYNSKYIMRPFCSISNWKIKILPTLYEPYNTTEGLKYILKVNKNIKFYEKIYKNQ